MLVDLLRRGASVCFCFGAKDDAPPPSAVAEVVTVTRGFRCFVSTRWLTFIRALQLYYSYCIVKSPSFIVVRTRAYLLGTMGAVGCRSFMLGLRGGLFFNTLPARNTRQRQRWICANIAQPPVVPSVRACRKTAPASCAERLVYRSSLPVGQSMPLMLRSQSNS